MFLQSVIAENFHGFLYEHIIDITFLFINNHSLYQPFVK